MQSALVVPGGGVIEKPPQLEQRAGRDYPLTLRMTAQEDTPTHLPEQDPRDAEAALTEKLVAIENALSSGSPTLTDPSPMDRAAGPNTWRDWIERALREDQWHSRIPPDAKGVFDPGAVRDHIRSLVSLARQIEKTTQLSSATHQRLRDALRLCAGFAGISALNSRESLRDGTPRVARFEIEPREKSRALARLLNGWTPAGADHAVPPIADLLLVDRAVHAPHFAGLPFFTALIECILNEGREISDAASLLRPFVHLPVVYAREAWVRFRIRFHRKDATLRESLSGLFRPGRRSSSPQEFWALRGVSLTAFPGETIGIVGRNGSGKTTLLKALAGILSADRGEILVRGRVGCLLSFGVGFNANLSGRENVFLNGSILGLPEREIARRLEQIVEYSELGEFIDAPVRTYSAGMRGRLGFSIAVHIDPDILILDEVLTVGDDYFQKKAGSILDRFHRENKTVIIASHSMELIRRVATRAVWIDQGAIRLSGHPTDVTRAYVADCRRMRGLSTDDDAAEGAPEAGIDVLPLSDSAAQM